MSMRRTRSEIEWLENERKFQPTLKRLRAELGSSLIEHDHAYFVAHVSDGQCVDSTAARALRVVGDDWSWDVLGQPASGGTLLEFGKKRAV